MSGEKFLYLLAGTGIGAAIGILFAPRAGADTRSSLGSTVSGLSHKVTDSDLGHQATNTLRSVMDRGKNVASFVKGHIPEPIEDETLEPEVRDLRSAIAAGRERLNESIESGRAEYNRAKNRDIAR